MKTKLEDKRPKTIGGLLKIADQIIKNDKAKKDAKKKK